MPSLNVFSQRPSVMHVQVIYAEPDHVLTCWLEVASESTVADCLLLAAVTPQFQTLDMSQLGVGIFGELCDPDRRVQDQDRVELYRGLRNDAKTARRLRAKQQTTAR